MVATDTNSGVASIELPGGQVVNNDRTDYTVTQNGTYEFKITDGVGNESTCSTEVSRIDKTATTIAVTLTSDE